MYTTDKGRKPPKIKLKQFADLNMWGTPMPTPLNPHNHPASANVRGTQMMKPTDMSGGDTGQQLPKNLDHSNIQD